MRTKFRGRSYRIRQTDKISLKNALAYTTDPQEPNRDMVFLDKLWKSPRLLEVLIHEPLHACFWDLSEEAVMEAARDIAKFLKKMGVVIRKEIPNGTV